MVSAKNGRWVIPFKKFSNLKVKMFAHFLTNLFVSFRYIDMVHIRVHMYMSLNFSYF